MSVTTPNPLEPSMCPHDFDPDFWRVVFRDGIAPHLSPRVLEEMHAALAEDDERILQGTICYPPPLPGLSGREVEGGDVFILAGMLAGEFRTVGECEAWFRELCDRCDEQFSVPAACRFFLNWYDATSREQMREQMLEEVAIARGSVPAMVA